MSISHFLAILKFENFRHIIKIKFFYFKIQNLARNLWRFKNICKAGNQAEMYSCLTSNEFPPRINAIYIYIYINFSNGKIKRDFLLDTIAFTFYASRRLRGTRGKERVCDAVSPCPRATFSRPGVLFPYYILAARKTSKTETQP